MKLRQVLPPIDTTQIRDFKLPFDLDEFHEKPLYERANHLFQEGLYIIDENEEDDMTSKKSVKYNRNDGV